MSNSVVTALAQDVLGLPPFAKQGGGRASTWPNRPVAREFDTPALGALCRSLVFRILNHKEPQLNFLLHTERVNSKAAHFLRMNKENTYLEFLIWSSEHYPHFTVSVRSVI